MAASCLLSYVMGSQLFSAAVDNCTCCVTDVVCFLLAEVQAIIIISPKFWAFTVSLSSVNRDVVLQSFQLSKCHNGTAFFLDIVYMLFVLVYVEVLSSLHLLCLFLVVYGFENFGKYVKVNTWKYTTWIKSELKSRLIMSSKSCPSASVDLSRIYLLP